MELITFKSYDAYVAAQRRTTLHKINRPQGYQPFAGQRAVKTIAKAHLHPVHRGLCHGVRGGEELDLFERHVGGDWIGTEIVEELCDGARIIHHDFERRRQDWLGLFDIVYSNSLDHAQHPAVAVYEWLCQLSHTGRLYVEWTKFSTRLGKGWNKADCYAASLDEYIRLIEIHGVVHDVIESRGKQRRIIVAGMACRTEQPQT